MKFSKNFLTLNYYKLDDNILNFYYYYSNIIYLNYNDLKYNVDFKYSKFFLLNYIIFKIKKEKRYTKLKYSRVPQVDISSGAIASLLAGLLGFLVTEKMGFELLDSGDFYLIVLYCIILLNSLRIIYKTLNIVDVESFSWLD